MRRILIASFGSYGDIYPFIGLALGLQRRGHEPVLATSEFYRAAIEREGLGFVPIRPNIDLHDPELLRRSTDAKHGLEYIITQLVLPGLRDSVADLTAAVAGADLLITQALAYAAVIVAERTGVPWTSTVLTPLSFWSRHDLPVVAQAQWTKRLERMPGGASQVIAIGRAITRHWGDPVRTLRRELGLPCDRNPLFEGQHSPAQVLALFSPVLARPQPDWPRNVRITGIIPYSGERAEQLLSPALQEFLAAGEPPVVFTLGTVAVGADRGFYRESIEVVRRLRVRGVLLAGPCVAELGAAGLPPGVHLEAFAPHSALFPNAAAIVHPGGIGTAHQGLRSGRPTLVVPFANDQPDVAWRLARLGVSRTLRPQAYRAGRVARELHALLHDPTYGERAKAVAAQVGSEDGVAAACDAIEARFRRP